MTLNPTTYSESQFALADGYYKAEAHICDEVQRRIKQTNERDLCKEHFGGLPLSTVIELVKQHYPEVYI